MNTDYASGTWYVKEGKEDVFVQRWREFLTWSRSTHPSMTSASLLQDRSLHGHFVSISEWTDAESRAAWKQTPEFQQLFGACAALCEKAKGADYDRVVTI